MLDGRVLGLDHGEKRIGVAVSDPLGMTAQVLPFLPNDGAFFEKLNGVIASYGVVKIVVGLPMNLKGGDSAQTGYVRVFAEEVRARTGLDVVFRDERLSTMAVTRHLIGAGVSREKRKHVIDSHSAAFVLQGYLDSCS